MQDDSFTPGLYIRFNEAPAWWPGKSCKASDHVEALLGFNEAPAWWPGKCFDPGA